MSAGWEYKCTESIVRASVDSKLRVLATVEESLGESFRISLSADLDVPSHIYKWGFGLHVNS